MDGFKHNGLIIRSDLEKSLYEQVQVGNDQEMAKSERKPRGGKKTKMTLRYLYHENISLKGNAMINNNAFKSKDLIIANTLVQILFKSAKK